MQTLAKSSKAPFHSVSGPAAQVLRELRSGAGSHVVALELPSGSQHLEPALRKALELLATIMDGRVAESWEVQARRIAELLTENVEVPQTAVLEGRMRAEGLRHLIEEGQWLTASQIAEQGGYSRSNPAEPASRWKREGKIFAISFKGQDLYAAYQFDGKVRPRPVISQVLKIFKHKSDALKIAAWFASVNGWLDGHRPQDRLDEPTLVVAAAKQEVSGFNG